MVLDEHRARVVRTLCELIVPGSGRVSPEVYVDALLARMPEPERLQILAAVDALEQPASAGDLSEHALTPEFMAVRALACEAFYSDFVAPGAPGPGAWNEIDFRPPLAARLNKDWSYLGVTG
jgi:DNA-binding transcriptional ArsR family regulator